MTIQFFPRICLLIGMALLGIGILPAHAQTNVQRIHSFGGNTPGEGYAPRALALASNGTFFGITSFGGPGNRGSIFRVSEDKTTRVTIRQFGTNSVEGRNPTELIYSADGKLYGLASGGANNVGVLFSIQTNGLNYTILRHMTNAPRSLVEASDGRLHFVESGIRRIEKTGANYQVISSFSAIEMIEANDGMLYAFNGLTTIRKVARDGSSEVDIITTFPPDELGVDPDEVSHLRQGADGFLYGLASELSGGTGYFFRTDTNGGSRVQVRFTAAARATAPTSFFQSPSDGLFYVAVSGSSGYRGGLFSISTSFMGTNLLTWPASTGGEFGALTLDRVTQGADGLLYGITDFGGNNFAGLLFRVERSGSNFTSLLSFAVEGLADGTNSSAPLILATNGLLYGTTRNGGLNNRGLVYRVNPDGTGYAVVRQFASDADGMDPAGGVVDGKDGFLYGATVAGGSQNLGTVYKLRYDGSQFSVMYNIRTNRPAAATPQDPSFCAGSLIADATNIYGVGLTGGSAGRGAIFAARKDGSLFTNIHNFIVGEARRPFAGLIEGLDGKLYGVTENGGANDAGVFYRLNKDGSAFQVLRAFGGGTDGTNPDGPLWQDSNGVLYGTTFGGGVNGFGTAFRLNPDGTGYSVIRHFGAGVDGRRPTCALAPGPNGTLLGTTRFGGSGPVGSQLGIIFQISKDGLNYEVLKSFTALSGDGGGPLAGLTAVSSNSFFVPTSYGGDFGFGTIQRLTFASPNPALVLASPAGTNAIIECGQSLAFTAPTFSGGCAPVVVSSNLVVTGGSCRQTNRAEWIATDSCGQTVTTSQTIIAIDSAPPFVVTPGGTNTTVNCGDALIFSAPAYNDACSATVTVTSNLVTIGASCPQTNVMTWIATDPCSNSTTNSQTIVVTAPAVQAPSINTQPVSVIGPHGHVANLNVNASSPQPVTYVWQFNGVDLLSATNNVLDVAISPGTAGAYSVRITGPGGATNSSPVSVTLFGMNNDRKITLLGATGASHRVEFVDSLTNVPHLWQTLTNTTLPNGTFEMVDPTAPAGARFYRAVTP